MTTIDRVFIVMLTVACAIGTGAVLKSLNHPASTPQPAIAEPRGFGVTCYDADGQCVYEACFKAPPDHLRVTVGGSCYLQPCSLREVVEAP